MSLDGALISAQQAPVIGSAVLPLREYLLTGLTATVVTFLLTGPVRVLAVRLGAVAWPRGRDVHSTPTPRWGGLAMLGGVLAGVLLAYQLPALRLAFDYSDEVDEIADVAVEVLRATAAVSVNGKPSKAKYETEAKVVQEARARITAPCDKFPVYPEIDLSIVEPAAP